MKMKAKEEVAYQLRSRTIVRQPLPSTPKKLPRVAVAPTVSKKITWNVPFIIDKARNEEYDKHFSARNMKEVLRISRMEWISWAEKTVEYYNIKKGCGFKLKEVKAVQISPSWGPTLAVHMNFTALSAQGASTSSLFYAELRVQWDIDPEKMFKVEGSCILEQVGSGIEGFSKCGACPAHGPAVIHPGPAYGYRNAEGDDDFVDSYFNWKNARVWTMSQGYILPESNITV